MTNAQKATFFILSGMIMLMGVCGGITESPNLISYDGLYLAAFATVGLGFMILGTSYSEE